jgi:outer membrane protein OmpA-like peptidoglycan-associated protein
MRRSLAAVAAIPLLGAALAAARAESGGPYAGLWVGPHFLRDSEVTGAGIDSTADFDAGFGVAGSVGYRLPFGLRAEAEGGFRASAVDSLSGAAGGRGDARALSVMVNALYDFETGTPFTPYLGFGAGAARIAFDGVSPLGGSRVDDTDLAPALQGLVGVGYAVTDSLQVFAGYRYFTALGAGFTTDSGVRVDADYGSHTVLVGFRWSFGHAAFGEEARPEPKAEVAVVSRLPAAPAAPAAAPEPKPAEAAAAAEPARPPAFPLTYLVFFEWDRADLTAEAREVVRTAADNARKGGASRLEATGHADRSGPDGYNMGLSRRRAETVKGELVRLGVPEREIAVFWKGEREPLVPTEDGVREAKNRRVEIVLR